jgi:hypothetical protein
LERMPELECKDRTYCHVVTCGTFIKSIHNNEAICQQCNARTCATCKYPVRL